MKKKPIILIMVISILIGFAAMVITTELLNQIIWPSLFVGIPVGIVASIVSYLILRKAAKSR